VSSNSNFSFSSFPPLAPVGGNYGVVSYLACASDQCVDIVMYTIHYTKIYIVDQEDELYLTVSLVKFLTDLAINAHYKYEAVN